MAIVATPAPGDRVTVAPAVELPAYPVEGVAGVFVGGCVARGVGSSFRARAHAHDRPGEYFGWICVRSSRRLLTARGGWSQLMLHEFAHIVAPGGHHDRWRKAARELGYRLPARYQRRAR